MKFHERPSRSLVKSISYRCAVVASDFVIVYILTHRVDTAAGLVVATDLASTTLYYLHERTWNHIHWGRSLRH